MADQVHEAGDVRILICDPAGPPLLRNDRDAADLVALGLGERADWIAVPAERLGDDFFRLGTRIAGDAMQKFVNYRLGLAVVGDISRHLDGSRALRDFVYESNRGRHIWFVADLTELESRLSGAPSPS